MVASGTFFLTFVLQIELLVYTTGATAAGAEVPIRYSSRSPRGTGGEAGGADDSGGSYSDARKSVERDWR